MTSALFWERLQATGLASPEVCRQWSKEIEASIGKESAGDALKIASSLLRSGRLTPFQLNCISESQPPTVVVGPFRLIDTLSDRLGPNWFEAIDATQDAKKWCFQLRPNQLCAMETRKWPPSIEFAKAHKELENSFLDRWDSIIAGQGTLSCFCDPVSGKPLNHYLQDGPFSVDESTRIVSQIASALQALHGKKLVHGNVSGLQCWYDGTNCTVRRSVLFVPSSPYSVNEDPMFKNEDQDRWMIAAPEFVLPDARPSPQTDLYALGVLWLQLLNGRSAWKRNGSLDALGWKKIHSQETPEIPGDLPENLQVILKSLLAKNPSVRCRDAATLLGKLPAKLVSNRIETSVKRASVDAKQGRVATNENGSSQALSKSTPNLTVEKMIGNDRDTHSQANPSIPSSKIAPAAQASATAKPNKVYSSLPSKVATPAASTPAAPTPAAPTPAAVTPAAVTPAAVTPAAVTPAAVTPAAVTPAAVTPAAVTPAAVTPAAVTPAAVTPAAVTPAAVTPAAVTPAAVTPAAATPVQPVTKQSATAQKPTQVASATKPQSVKKSDGVSGKRKKKKPAWFLPVLAIGSMTFMGILVVVLSSFGGGKTNPEPITKVTTIPSDNLNGSKDAGAKRSPEVLQSTVDPIAEYYSVLPDDGESLWAPPAVGATYSVELLPPGLELFAVFSQGAWTGQKTGPVQSWLLESLPAWKSLVSSYPNVDDDQIKRVTVAAYPAASSTMSEMILRIELKNPIAIKDMLGRNPAFREQRISGTDTELYCWSNGTLAIVFDGLSKDSERKISTYSVGPSRIINAFGETSGGSAPLSRQLESLISVSNSEMDFFVLTTPSFLNGNGRELYSSVPRFKEFFRSVVDDSVQAFSIAASLENTFYLEGRMIVGDVAKSGSILSKARDTLDGLANSLESQFAINPVVPYWRLIAARYPQMIRSVARNARMGIEEGQLVINLYQPRESFDNLAIGTWMAMQNTGSGSAQKAVESSIKMDTPKLSVEDLLNRPMSIAFAQESLEMSLAAIATEFNDSLPEGENRIEMTINGGAFQKEGITQNQQIRDFSFEKKPLRDLLTSLVRRANPVTTVQSPTEKDQKVVWLVLENSNSPGGKKIELTTRTWAEANGGQLPKEFLP